MLRWFGISLWDQPVLQNRTRKGKKLCVPWSLLWDGSAHVLGSPWGCPELAPLISCPISVTPGIWFFRENPPWGLREIILEGWDRTAGGDGAALFLKDVQTVLFCPKSLSGEPEERFPNQKNPTNPQGFGEIKFLSPYLLMEGGGERGRMLEWK